MSHTPNFDKRISDILAATSPGERTCALLGTKWHMDEREIAQYRKYNVPPSKYHPITRMKMMMSYFVLFDFWYNKNAETGETILSTTHPASGVKVLPDTQWFARDFMEYGHDVDMSRSIFDQLYDLTRVVPQAANYNYVLPENSTAFISLGDQDSHFVLACQSKRCFYVMNGYDIEDSAELSLVKSARECYNVGHSERLYRCRWARECYDCINCDFVFDCRNCENCFGATNKRNKKFLWFNEQLNETEWRRRFAEVDLTSWKTRQEYERKFRELVEQAVWPENFNIKAENCTGEYITGANNIEEGYYIKDGSHDLWHATFGFSLPSNDCYCVCAPVGSSDCYYSLGIKSCSRTNFGLSILSNCIDTEYCASCQDVEHCFGCVALKKKKFCIFNKQYSEADYWRTLDALKCKMLEDGEYGDYPPIKFSYQYVKRSGAPVVYGATEEELQKMGAVFFDISTEGAEGPAVDPTKVQDVETIPDIVLPLNKGETEGVCGKPFMDRTYGRRFGYVTAELALYARLKVAPPRAHPTRRVNELFAEMNMAVFENIACHACEKNIHVAQNRVYPNRKIFCRSCYLQFIEQHG